MGRKPHIGGKTRRKLRQNYNLGRVAAVQDFSVPACFYSIS